MRTIQYIAIRLKDDKGYRLLAINLATNERGTLDFNTKQELEAYIKQNDMQVSPWVDEQ